ncbi:Zinc finger, RING/FYVE/PHD-type [Artemisia annua]|uniref:Zinc finger, RING/FYVE/PHD-type n=1 Tax=Artemisia annua TaxID=35608 RepID=A0A2U1PN19_ARTAN|nr:Zinc finger, RING/FYVE/PHD-type [Artemisia annua]
MPRRRSAFAFDPVPETTVDLNQGSSSNGMDESDDWKILPPMESRLLNTDLSDELNFGCVNVNTNSRNNFRSLSSWDDGESSSRGSIQDRVNNDGLKTEPNWLASGSRDLGLSEKQQVESLTSYPHDSFIGGHGAAGPSSLRSSETNRIPMNVNLNIGYEDSTSDDEDGMGFMDFYKSSETEVGGSSAGNWGMSCKRKTFEGTSAQSLATGTGSSCFPQVEDIARPHGFNGSRSLNISPALVNPVPMNRYEQPSTRIGVGTSVPLVPLVPESLQQFGPRGSVPYNNLASSGNPNRLPNISASQARQSNRQILLNEFLDHTNRGPTVIPPNLSNNSSNPQPPLMPVPTLPRNAPHFLWGNNIGSRTGSSSNSQALPLERGSEANFRSMLRNNMQYHSFVPPSETRNVVQDPTNWSLTTGNASSNGGVASSSSRNGSGSGGSRSFNPVWATPSQQRSSELPPWTLFPSADPESGSHRGQFPPFPGGSSTSEDNHISSGTSSQQHQYPPFSRSGLLMEAPGDDWDAIATDMEGMRRMVSRVCAS